MKVVLDLTKLRAEGKITPAEYDRLSAFAAGETGSLAINVLIGFGVIAVAAGAVALVPSAVTAMAIGGLVLAVGLGMSLSRLRSWELLANICMLAGALLFAAGTIWFAQGDVRALLFIAALFALLSFAANSALLMTGSLLALSACIGARTGYQHASYFLAIQEPTATIVIFGVLALVAYNVSRMLRPAQERLLVIAARTSVFLVNFGFWIGSLWGDRLLWLRSLWSSGGNDLATGVVIEAWVFAVLWALALVIVGAWGAYRNRGWVVNVAAIFGAIHFYTQWFERLGATPLSILLAGFLVLAFALALWQFNRRPAR